MPNELLLIGPRAVTIASRPARALQPREVRAQAILSGISHGTELNLYRGGSPFHSQRFDPDLRLFLEDSTCSPYPMPLGYEWVGRVTEVSAEVVGFRPGDLVHLPVGHRTEHVFPAGEDTMLGPVVPLPPMLTPERAVFLALAGVALQAVHDAHIKLGDQVAIFGLGAIGLLALELARLDGAVWLAAVEPLPQRRALAEARSADLVLDPGGGDVARAIKAAAPRPASASAGVDVAIELSGHYPALQEAIRSVRVGGVVVAAGYYQGAGAALRLGAEWHHNRVTMVSSMGVWGCPHRDHPLWSRGRVHVVAADLLASGRLHVDDLITHRIPFARAAEAYRLIDERPHETVKVILTY